MPSAVLEYLRERLGIGTASFVFHDSIFCGVASGLMNFNFVGSDRAITAPCDPRIRGVHWTTQTACAFVARMSRKPAQPRTSRWLCSLWLRAQLNAIRSTLARSPMDDSSADKAAGCGCAQTSKHRFPPSIKAFPMAPILSSESLHPSSLLHHGHETRLRSLSFPFDLWRSQLWREGPRDRARGRCLYQYRDRRYKVPADDRDSIASPQLEDQSAPNYNSALP